MRMWPIIENAKVAHGEIALAAYLLTNHGDELETCHYFTMCRARPNPDMCGTWLHLAGALPWTGHARIIGIS